MIIFHRSTIPVFLPSDRICSADLARPAGPLPSRFPAAACASLRMRFCISAFLRFCISAASHSGENQEFSLLPRTMARHLQRGFYVHLPPAGAAFWPTRLCMPHTRKWDAGQNSDFSRGARLCRRLSDVCAGWRCPTHSVPKRCVPDLLVIVVLRPRSRTGSIPIVIFFSTMFFDERFKSTAIQALSVGAFLARTSCITVLSTPVGLRAV